MRFTQADVVAHYARLNKSKTAVPSDAVEQESQLHQEILADCKARGWLAFHGSMAHRTARTIGEPDFIVCADNGQVIFVECKTKTGKLSVEQQGVIAWAAKLGHTVHVVRSFVEYLHAVNSELGAQTLRHD